jgi:hypothetical protein
MEEAVILGKQKICFWDNCSLREADFKNMQLLPGRQKMKFAAEPLKSEDPAEVAAAAEKQAREGMPKLLTAQDMERMRLEMRRRTDADAYVKRKAREDAAAMYKASPKRSSGQRRGGYLEEEEKANRLFNERMAGQKEHMDGEEELARPRRSFEQIGDAVWVPPSDVAEGVPSMVHYIFRDLLNKPRIAFGTHDDFSKFSWQRQLDLCEDNADTLVCISKIYAEILTTYDDPQLPILGSLKETMAAFSLACFMANVSPVDSNGVSWTRKRSFWRFSVSKAIRRPASAPAGTGRTPPMGPARDNAAASRPQSAAGSRSSWSSSKLAPAPFSKGGAEPRPLSASSGIGEIAKLGKALPIFGARAQSATATRMREKELLATRQDRPPENSVSFITFRLPETPENRTLMLRIVETWNEWKRSTETLARSLLAPLPEMDGGYQWVSRLNTPECRITRIEYACKTLMLTEGAAKRITNFSPTWTRTKPARGVSGQGRPQVRTEPNENPIDIAMRHTKQGRRAGAVVFCKGENVGGGFMNGIWPGLEEEMCLRSDFYASLRDARAYAEKNNLTNEGQVSHIPMDGTLVCHDVKVYRSDCESGYAALSPPVVVNAIFATELANLNPQSTMDAAKQLEISKMAKTQNKYYMRVAEKFDMIVKAAIDNELDVLAISDGDTQRLRNDPVKLGKTLGLAIAKTGRSREDGFPLVILSGSSAFLAGVTSAIARERL